MDDKIKAIQDLVRLFDEQGNMVGSFEEMTNAVEQGYAVLSRSAQGEKTCKMQKTC